MIGQTLGHYRLLEEIGGGGQGKVYRARHPRLPRGVAVKVLPAGALPDEGARKRFRNEALALSQLNHPAICTVHDFDTQDGVDFLVMEYIPGVTLSEKMTGSPLPEKEVLRLGIQLAQGLAAAHAAGVSHQDLKPGNLRITLDGRLKILDFGLAKLFGPASATAETEPADAGDERGGGTLPYMAPEQLRGEKTDARTDIYAAGAVLYEMATGRRPFLQPRGPQLITAILQQPLNAPSAANPRIPPGLETIILKALDKDPDRRYQSARELAVDLERLSTPGPGPDPPPPPPPWWVLVAAVAVLGAIAVPGPRREVAAILCRAGWLRLCSIPGQKNVVVLPFEAIGEAAEDRDYCKGLTETVTAKLARVPSLQVTPAAIVRERRVNTVEEARAELGANVVLRATWQRAGDQVRINLSVVDTPTGRHLRTDTITEQATDLFALQDRVLDGAVRMLEVAMHPHEAPMDTAQPAAYKDYLRGRAYLQDYHNRENIETAIDNFQHAIELDPRYALAHAGLGEAYYQMYRQVRASQWVNKALTSCERAVSLDAGRAQGYICLGQVYTETGKYEQAVEQFEKAVGLEPGDEAYRGLATAYERLGKLREAEKTYRRAIDMRPRYWAGYSWLGAFYSAQARYPEAAEMFDKVVELAPYSFRSFSNLAGIYILQGRYTDAIAMSQRSVDIRPNASAYNQLALGDFYRRRFAEAARNWEEAVKLDPRNHLYRGNLGDGYYWTPGKRADATRAYQGALSLVRRRLGVNPHDAAALGFLAKYHAMLEEEKPALSYLDQALDLSGGEPELQFLAALVHNRFGDADQALEWLEKAVAAGYSLNTVRDDPIFDNLHANPRFQKLLRRESGG